MRASLVQSRLISIIDTLVRAIVKEICELKDVSVFKHLNEAGPPELDRSLGTDVKLASVTAALEKLTKQTVEQIIKLLSPLPSGAYTRVPLSFKKRRRKWLSGETQLVKRRNPVKSRLTGVQSAETNSANKERGLGDSAQGETVSGETDLLFFSEDTLNAPEELLLQSVEETITCVLTADAAQQTSVLKVELDHEEEHVKCSTKYQEQKVEAQLDQRDSAVKAFSTEENMILPNSSDTLEIKISAAQSLSVDDGAKENAGPHEQETLVRAGRTRRGTAARKLMKCEACGKTFTYLNNLKRHQKTFHSGETLYACQNCGEGFSSKQLLRVHLREHRVEKPHRCKLCEKVFRLPNHLRKHMTTHSTERPFTCSTCGKSFASISTLRGHVRTHSGEKTFVCALCGMSFLTKSYLDCHQRVHTGEKPYTCMHCGKTFAQKSNLRVHERQHTGEKPFRCGDCGESFLHANSYKSHKQLHTGVKAFCCEHCGKGFRRGTHLKTHLLTHSGVKPFKCDLCPKTFTLKGSLKSHRLTHTGERSFVCNICNKSFTQASSLGKHKRTHTGEKPYHCAFCNKSFCQSSHLHYHYRAAHAGARPGAADVTENI